MTAWIVFERAADATDQPFSNVGLSGSGPSGSTWDEAHLRWIGVKFGEDRDLVGQSDQTALFTTEQFPSSTSRLVEALRKEFGLTWEQIQTNQEDNHYTVILALSEHRPTGYTQDMASSSERAEWSSSPRDEGQGSASSLPRDDAHGSVSSHGSHQVTADGTAEHYPSSPPNAPNFSQAQQRTSEGGQASTMTGPSSADTSSVPSSQASDSSFEPEQSSPSQQLPQPVNEDKAEAAVNRAAFAFLQQLLPVLKSIRESGSTQPRPLSCRVEDPETRRMVIDGSTCTCKSDVQIYAQLDDMDMGERKFGLVYGEFKRLNHNRTPAQILGQEVATLLSLAAGQHSIGKEARGAKRLRTDPIKKTYLFSCHHLEGYISRLDARPSTIARLADIHQPQFEPHEPLVIRRSKRFDLKDGNARVEFMTGIVASLAHFMGKYSGFDELVQAWLRE